MRLKLAAIADLHYATASPSLCRRGHLADILLQRVVDRLNRWIKPDVALFLGDLVEDGLAPDAEARWAWLREIAADLACPSIFLPGNHDGDPAAFHRVFPAAPVVDLAGARFITFLDPEEPGWNARRLPADLDRMAAARGFPGPVVMLQHCPLFPAGASDCPYHYTNASEILARMRGEGITLAISGHYHRGEDLIRHPAGSFVIVPALCEQPFPFLEIELRDCEVSVRRHNLAMSPELGLVDRHVHTPFAYCSEDMDWTRAQELGQACGLAGVAFTEHTGQLYFDRDTFRSGRIMPAGICTRQGRDDRMGDYLAAVRRHCRRGLRGLEVDSDHRGRPIVRRRDARRVDLLLGSIHSLPEVTRPQPRPERLAEEYLAILQALVGSGIGVLAHPFRVFRRARVPVPRWLHAPTARLLREHGVAAEVNFHKQAPEGDFIRLCLREGVRLSLGSDAHALWEVGELWPHLELLRACGVEGDLAQVLV